MKIVPSGSPYSPLPLTTVIFHKLHYFRVAYFNLYHTIAIAQNLIQIYPKKKESIFPCVVSIYTRKANELKIFKNPIKYEQK